MHNSKILIFKLFKVLFYIMFTIPTILFVGTGLSVDLREKTNIVIASS